MNLRPAAMVSRIPQAVVEGSALSRPMNFLQIVYSVLTRLEMRWNAIQISLCQADVERIPNIVWKTLKFTFNVDAQRLADIRCNLHRSLTDFDVK